MPWPESHAYPKYYYLRINRLYRTLVIGANVEMGS